MVQPMDAGSGNLESNSIKSALTAFSGIMGKLANEWAGNSNMQSAMGNLGPSESTVASSFDSGANGPFQITNS